MISSLFVTSAKRASNSAYQKWQEQILEMRKIAYKDPLSRSRMSKVGIQQVEDSLEIKDENCYGVDNPRFLETYPVVRNKTEFHLPVKVDIKKLKYPSVTRIIGQSKSADQLRILEIWKQNEIEKRGLEGFELYQKKMFSDGHKVHSIIEHFYNEERDFGSLGRRLEESDQDVQDYLVSVMPILKNKPMKIQVKALEFPAKHSMLPYCGIIDCIANIEGIGWTVIDWKTSQKRKPTLSRCYDDPLQVAAYCSILGITNGCLVKIYKDREADILMMNESDINYYWKEFCTRYEVYLSRIEEI